jgi:probable phosphomutase (TIGR03848 family)
MVTQLLLIRHGMNDWVGSGRLAGWTPGVYLNDEGRRQAEALGARLASVNLAAVYSSPLERAVETAQAIVSPHPRLDVMIENDVGEVHYGEWNGKRLRRLERTRLWKIIQATPSFARFPGGESIREMQARAIAAVERIRFAHPEGTVALVSHGDVISVIIAHYAGMHLDLYQRLVIWPASLSIIILHEGGSKIALVNDTSHYTQLDEGVGEK